jgi:FtsP/CotA-like multicopper oxidase with cupredoxin domain/plastocyanin
MQRLHYDCISKNHSEKTARRPLTFNISVSTSRVLFARSDYSEGSPMAVITYWIQLENHPWDVSPNQDDRMTGRPASTLPPVSVTLKSPVTGFTQTRTMFNPLQEKPGEIHSALILRRYTENWGAPDDRKVNPWDINEPDPTDTGTMGTVPGPVIECNVGDSMVVHFRNLDLRTDASGALLPIENRTHSLHPHGFVFDRFSDGAYPLSPPDPSQPVGAEGPAWTAVKVTGSKQGDRVPPPSDVSNPIATSATYTYKWNTFGWPSTAGVWLYHDHSICDMENVEHGAIGIIVIHNPNDEQDVDIRDPHDATKYQLDLLPGGVVNGSPVRSTSAGDVFVNPPARALYLQLFHTMGHNSGMTINGRKYLGNTPTMLAGPETQMRFGVVGMNDDEFHTFHLHGHRWVIPGPDGSTPDAIQASSLNRAVSQFEDTRIFGPANSFSFSINNRSTASGGVPSFMRAGGPNAGDNKGEWHMHCHVLMHMDEGMMGSLVIADGGDPVVLQAATLACPPQQLPANTVTARNFAFEPSSLTVSSGTQVNFFFKSGTHTVETLSATAGATIITINNGTPTTPIPVNQIRSVIVSGPAGAVISYDCGIHGSAMPGEIRIQ